MWANGAWELNHACSLPWNVKLRAGNSCMLPHPSTSELQISIPSTCGSNKARNVERQPSTAWSRPWRTLSSRCHVEPLPDPSALCMHMRDCTMPWTPSPARYYPLRTSCASWQLLRLQMISFTTWQHAGHSWWRTRAPLQQQGNCHHHGNHHLQKPAVFCQQRCNSCHDDTNTALLACLSGHSRLPKV